MLRKREKQLFLHYFLFQGLCSFWYLINYLGKSKNISVIYEYIVEDIVNQQKNTFNLDRFISWNLGNKRIGNQSFIQKYSLNVEFQEPSFKEDFKITPNYYLVNIH